MTSSLTVGGSVFTIGLVGELIIWGFAVIGIFVSVFLVGFYINNFYSIIACASSWKCRPFDDAWFASLLRHYCGVGIRVLLSNPKATNNLTEMPILAGNINFPFFYQQSVIFLNHVFLYHEPSFLHFVLAHELGHILNEKGRLHRIFWPFTYSISREINADAFAVLATNRIIAQRSLEMVETLLFMKNSPDLNMRIMALHMPTLFYRYA